jgi:hypothetical protein
VTDETEFLETIACLAFATVSAVYVGSIVPDKPLVREWSRKDLPDRWLGR